MKEERDKEKVSENVLWLKVTSGRQTSSLAILPHRPTQTSESEISTLTAREAPARC